MDDLDMVISLPYINVPPGKADKYIENYEKEEDSRVHEAAAEKINSWRPAFGHLIFVQCRVYGVFMLKTVV